MVLYWRKRGEDGGVGWALLYCVLCTFWHLCSLENKFISRDGSMLRERLRSWTGATLIHARWHHKVLEVSWRQTVTGGDLGSIVSRQQIRAGQQVTCFYLFSCPGIKESSGRTPTVCLAALCSPENPYCVSDSFSPRST